MSVNLNFNPAEHEPMREREPVPNGKYRAQIIESEMKPTKAGTGRYLQLTWQIMDEGPYKGQYIWATLNLDNPSQQAVDIAQRELTSICLAIGHTGRVSDSGQLHNKPALITVVVEEKKGYAPKNKIRKYEPMDGVAGALPSAAAPAPSSNAPAWAQARKSA